MGKFENNILGFVPKKDWIDLPIDVSRPNDPIDGLFDDRKTNNLMAEWETLQAQYRLSGMAYFHGFDTEAQTTIRMPVDRHSIEKGLVKVKINQSERLQALMDNGVQDEGQLYRYVINDGLHLADDVITRTKAAKYEIMSSGKMTIKENNLDLTVEYGVPDAQTSLTLDFGTGAAKPIPDQIQDIIDMAKNQGVTINGMMTASKNITKMRNNGALQIIINGSASSGAQLRRGALESYLSDEYGIDKVIAADLTYRIITGIGQDGRPIVQTKRYYDENKVTFFATTPGGKLGRGLWGNPPESYDTDLIKVRTSERSPYVWISQKKEWDPAVLWTKASALFIPMIYDPNSLFICTTANTVGA